MLGQAFMRNALLAGTFIALACGVSGWFVVLRGQVFAGDALSHVAFPAALAAAAAGIDQQAGLFVATVAVGALIGILGRAGRPQRGTLPGAGAAGEEAAIGIVFTLILGVGLFFLTRLSVSAAGGSGIRAAHTLFGSIFGLAEGEAWLAAGLGVATLALTATIARPLLFASVSPELAAARGVPTRLLAVAFLALVGLVAAEATQAVGALLLLGLLTGPAAAAHRITAAPVAGIALAGALAVAAMWLGLVLAYLLPWLPPSTAVVVLAAGTYYGSLLLGRAGGRPHR